MCPYPPCPRVGPWTEVAHAPPTCMTCMSRFATAACAAAAATAACATFVACRANTSSSCTFSTRGLRSIPAQLFHHSSCSCKCSSPAARGAAAPDCCCMEGVCGWRRREGGAPLEPAATPQSSGSWAGSTPTSWTFAGMHEELSTQEGDRYAVRGGRRRNARVMHGWRLPPSEHSTRTSY